VTNVTMITTHPFAALNATSTFSLICGSKYVIVHDFETSSPEIIARANRMVSRDIASGLATNSEAVFGGGMELTALMGLQQWHLSRKLFSRLANVVGYSHHFVGLLGQESGYYIDLPGYLVSAISATNSVDDENAWFGAEGLFASALEHGSLEQSQGWKCASTIKLLEISNGNGKKTFLTDSNNWASVRTNLLNYTVSQTNTIAQNIAAGHIYLLPESAKITNQQWVGVGYIDFNGVTKAMGMIISGNLSGAYTGIPVWHNSTSIVNLLSQAEITQQPANIEQKTSLDPIDLHSGNALADRTDLILGNAPEPCGLTFARYYDSGQNYRKDVLGYGWTHNYDISANTVSHGAPGLGDRQPMDAAPLIAQGVVALDLMRGAPD
jgi:hypothetical protein